MPCRCGADGPEGAGSAPGTAASSGGAPGAAPAAALDYRQALVSSRGDGRGPVAQRDGLAAAAAPPPPPPGPAGGGGPGAATALKLDDLQPDVLYHVLLFLQQADVAHMKLCSSRLRCNVRHACQHWAPKVEAWLMADPSSAALLRRLRTEQLHTPEAVADAPRQGCAGGPTVQGGSGAGLQRQQQQLPPQQQRQRQQGPAPSPAELVAAPPRTPWIDWRQVWSCIERAQRGPWQLDVGRLTPVAVPNGVLLTFELLLQNPAPLAAPGAPEQHMLGWRDSVTVMSFVLDGKAVEIMVDASGRVTSPQRDWCQGCIQLQPNQPRLLALEVSYLFSVPAWFLHPCTLAAPPAIATFGGSGSSCASSVSGMAVDPTWDSYSAASSSMSVGQSTALCSAVQPAGRADSCSLATSSLTSSGGSVGHGAAHAGSSCGGGALRGRPRLSLDLSIGFGSYVIDPRYIDDASPHLVHRGLARLDLASHVCWRPSKVQSWLGRLLPGIRGHTTSSVGGGAAAGGAAGGGPLSRPAAAAAPGGSAGSAGVSCSPGGGTKPGSKPSFAVALSKAAVWHVPSDTDRRFAEGFMFWAVQHQLERLLVHYGLLQ